MKVVVCVDDAGGMAFNRRRQSRDRVLCEDIIKNEIEGRFLIAPYSIPLFENYGIPIAASADFLSLANSSDTCFVEDCLLRTRLDKIDKLVIYRWNRRYPADLYLDIFPDRDGFRLIEQTEFTGSSHEKITKEIFEK